MLRYNSMLIGEIPLTSRELARFNLTLAEAPSDSSATSVCEEDPESFPSDLSGRRLVGKPVSGRDCSSESFK